MRILIACEESGTARDAFRRKGHDAISCDILPTSKPGPHIQGKLEDIIGSGKEWDMIIAFPPCTYLCSSGLHWNDRGRGWENTEQALKFVAMIMNRDCSRIAIENPRGCISTRLWRGPCGRIGNLNYGKWQVAERGCTPISDSDLPPMQNCKPAQTIQPYQFGEDASKATCLWLKGLPPLSPTKYIEPRMVNGKPRWGNQTDSGQNRIGPSEDRARLRAVTYLGIAEAMAEQWGNL